jgi:hypothetical protein
MGDLLGHQQGEELAIAQALLLGALREIGIKSPHRRQMQATEKRIDVDRGAGAVIRSPQTRPPGVILVHCATDRDRPRLSRLEMVLTGPRPRAPHDVNSPRRRRARPACDRAADSLDRGAPLAGLASFGLKRREGQQVHRDPNRSQRYLAGFTTVSRAYRFARHIASLQTSTLGVNVGLPMSMTTTAPPRRAHCVPSSQQAPGPSGARRGLPRGAARFRAL